jgi:hypothetical protein
MVYIKVMMAKIGTKDELTKEIKQIRFTAEQ